MTVKSKIWWILASIVAVLLDLFSAPTITLNQLFIFPVGLAAWTSGLGPALALSAVLSAERLFSVYSSAAMPTAHSLLNAAIRLTVLSSFAVLVFRVRRSLALTHDIRILRGLLPICGFCKRIRDPHNQWHPLEEYISMRSEADFTHGVCPTCVIEHYGETFDRR